MKYLTENLLNKETHQAMSSRIPTKKNWPELLDDQIITIIPVHQLVISGIKLLVILPLLIFSLKQTPLQINHPMLVISFFLLFVSLDYLDGIIQKRKESHMGRLVDRLTYLIGLMTILYFCLDSISAWLLIVKLILDLIIAVLYISDRGGRENRLQSGLNYTVFFALITLSQAWTPYFITINTVGALLWINISFLLLMVLFDLKILQKRFIADALSGANLFCGVFSIFFAARNRVDISLLFLMLGAAFDGFDGAAARKFGGTRWGVYSDDVADGVNYGIAPGFALYLILGGMDGLFIGLFYSFFTISRLIFFTLNKVDNDPNFFCGVPSTVGALITICSLSLFQNYQSIIGLMVGTACIQMVSFDTHYRHLGRALASNRRVIYGMPLLIFILLIGNSFWGSEISISLILAASLIYGFLPTGSHFLNLIKKDK
jgi:CDP-diacylglycerol---serine O-phosphatidyltransferase